MHTHDFSSACHGPRISRSPCPATRASGRGWLRLFGSWPLEGSFLPPLREAERRNGASTTGAPLRRRPRALARARAPSGAPPQRFLARSPYFFHRTGGFSPLTLSRQHSLCPSSDVVQAT